MGHPRNTALPRNGKLFASFPLISKLVGASSRCVAPSARLGKGSWMNEVTLFCGSQLVTRRRGRQCACMFIIYQEKVEVKKNKQDTTLSIRAGTGAPQEDAGTHSAQNITHTPDSRGHSFFHAPARSFYSYFPSLLSRSSVNLRISDRKKRKVGGGIPK